MLSDGSSLIHIDGLSGILTYHYAREALLLFTSPDAPIDISA